MTTIKKTASSTLEHLLDIIHLTFSFVPNACEGSAGCVLPIFSHVTAHLIITELNSLLYSPSNIL
jgi:hypothetical protein